MIPGLICQKPLGAQAEMHEVFLTRGDVQMAPSIVREAIHAAENCVLVHPACHSNAQSAARAKELCAAQLITFEGYRAIKAWLLELEGLLKTSYLAREALHYVNAVTIKLEIPLSQSADGDTRSWLK
jgi:hypothetical protein